MYNYFRKTQHIIIFLELGIPTLKHNSINLNGKGITLYSSLRLNWNCYSQNYTKEVGYQFKLSMGKSDYIKSQNGGLETKIA